MNFENRTEVEGIRKEEDPRLGEVMKKRNSKKTVLAEKALDVAKNLASHFRGLFVVAVDRNRIGSLACPLRTCAPVGLGPQEKGAAGPGSPVWHQAIAPYKPRNKWGSRSSPQGFRELGRVHVSHSWGPAADLGSPADSPVATRSYRQAAASKPSGERTP